MTAHTPGPWSAPETNQVNYMGDTYNVDVVYNQIYRGQEPLAFVVIGNPEQSVANTRLITAAPMLLDALKDLLDAASGTATQVLRAQENAHIAIKLATINL